MRFVLARFLARSLPQLAVLAVMLLSFAPQSSAFWECEGQACGATPWVCCCQQPAASEDSGCQFVGKHFTHGEHASEVGPCPVDCHCTMVVQDGSPSLHSTSHFFVPPVFVLVQPPVVPEVNLPPAEATPFTAPSRGPPLRSIHLATAFLRGPPLA